MQIRYASRLSLLILSFVAAMLIFPAMAFAETVAPDGTTQASLPTIQSDLADYPPGGAVTLTGSNWQPGESVHINVNDTYGASWSRNVDVTADSSGQIADSFNLPDWFVSDYDVTATGAQSGTATTTFTDSQPNSVSVNPATEASKTVTQGSPTTPYPVQVQMGGNGQTCTVTMSVTTEPAVMQGNTVVQPADTGLPAGTTVNFAPNSFNSTGGTQLTPLVIGTSATTPAGTYTFHVKANSGSNCQGGTNSSPVSTQQLTLIVTSAAPVAANDSYSVNEDNTLSVSAPGVLGNDTGSSLTVKDSDANTAGVQPVSGTSNGTLNLNANGSFTYAPNGSFNGTDSFTFKANDGSLDSNTATVSITVAPTITNIAISPLQALVGQPVSFTGTATDPSSADTTAGFTWQWSKDGGGYVAGSNPYTTSFSSCGAHTVSAKATDKNQGTSAPFTTSTSVQVYNGTYLAPLKPGMDNMVQKGQVVPVKISVAGCDGINKTGLVPDIRLLSGDPTANTNEADFSVPTSVSSADNSGVMRPVDGGYIYNLQVPNGTTLKAGDKYYIRVSPFGIASGQHMIISIQIRK
jgi:VCBS repeat-containing protein